jgi:hypothetical protein
MALSSAFVRFIFHSPRPDPSVSFSEDTVLRAISLQPAEKVKIQLFDLKRRVYSSVSFYLDVLSPDSFSLLTVSIGALASCRCEMFCSFNGVGGPTFFPLLAMRAVSGRLSGP